MNLYKDIKENWRVYLGGFISGALATLGVLFLLYAFGFHYFEIIGV